jgi:hypothetical protein
MTNSKLSFSLILAFLALTIVAASPLSRRGTCITNPIAFTGFKEQITISVQNKTHPAVHKLPVSYAPVEAYPNGPVEHFLALRKNPPPNTTKFRFTDEMLFFAHEVSIPEAVVPAYTRESKFKDLIEIYFPASTLPQPPTTRWVGYWGCNDDTGAVQLEIGVSGASFCAKKDGETGYRLYMKTIGMYPCECVGEGDG